MSFYLKARPAALWLIAFVVLSQIANCQEGLIKKNTTSAETALNSGTTDVASYLKKYPEILWLADADVVSTQEGVASSKDPYSKQFFGERYIEFDRTILSLKCLDLIFSGDDCAFKQFVKRQKKDVCLSKESFNQLHQKVLSLFRLSRNILTEKDMIQALETALVLGDIGKSAKAREIFNEYGANAPDHDDFHEQVIKILQTHEHLCPSYSRLNPAAKKLVASSANLAHYGHITHLEGDLGMFSQLKTRSADKDFELLLAFDTLVHICDVAGALGHVERDTSLVYTQNAFDAMEGVIDSCKVFESQNGKAIDAYNLYLSIRAKLLGLDPFDKKDRVLTRMAAMLRLFTPGDGSILKCAIQNLSDETRECVVKQLDINVDSNFKRTPTYMPAVLINLANNPQLGSSFEERLSNSVTLGLPFIARVLANYNDELIKSKLDSNIPLCFNSAAGVVKVRPDALSQSFTIDEEGNVLLDGFKDK